MPDENTIKTSFIYDRKDLEDRVLLDLYKALLRPRLIEEKMLILLRQGKISKWFSGIGQEAIAVGVTSCLHDDEYILPMHRNLGVFTTREIPLHRLFSQWQGTMNGFTKGRDRSFHFGTQEYKIIGMISHLGPQLGVACGIALGHKLRKEPKITAVFTGEGGTSEGDFHEALNLASVWKLPVLFCIENNAYGLSTPTVEQYNCKHLVDRGSGYGMRAYRISGNNILEIYSRISMLAEEMRKDPHPVLIEFETFRMRGHEESSGTDYVPATLLAQWALQDPVRNYQSYLVKEGLLDPKRIVQYEQEVKTEIERQLAQAYNDVYPTADTTSELADVYAPYRQRNYTQNSQSRNMRFVDAIHDALNVALKHHKDLVIMGQDIADYGGVFKVTEGLSNAYGKDRVRNTPICESAVIEAAMGLSINGFKALVELQFADFVSSGFNPIVNYLAKTHYRWGEPARVVLRLPCGAGVGAGPFHSQSNEAWFNHVPGLKIVYPAFPEDAKGLLLAAINDPNPVLFFEHKALYRRLRQDVPEGYYETPLGEARIIQSGSQISIITYGAAVHWVLELSEDLKDLNIELIDLRSLVPLDYKTIADSVCKTGKVLLLSEDNLTGSVISDIAAYIAEECFKYLDAPVMRLAAVDTPIPFAQSLEENYLPKKKLLESIYKLIQY